jgi:hypothetical protein
LPFHVTSRGRPTFTEATGTSSRWSAWMDALLFFPTMSAERRRLRGESLHSHDRQLATGKRRGHAFLVQLIHRAFTTPRNSAAFTCYDRRAGRFIIQEMVNSCRQS